MRKLVTLAAMVASALPVQAQVQGQVKARTAPEPQAQVPPEALPGFDRFARARDNLLALRDGRRAVGDLTRQELQDVIDLDRQVRGSAADTRSFRERCIDNEVRREGGNPSRLAWEVIKLKCRD
ncbi:hypothetical protein [Erythrobacter oryzae]|uniref:hypothetical protein n=1 Tax=Erythrobacter oryzae TaxID=3019556 RepID=UPI00255251C8|nr:hypothetical protein [Erythrobacter sp. COR-2]